jgi:hypothetical protein
VLRWSGKSNLEVKSKKHVFSKASSRLPNVHLLSEFEGAMSLRISSISNVAETLDKDFYGQIRLLASTNGTNSENESNNRVLRIKWYLVLVLVVAIIIGSYLAYLLCFRRTMSKRKLHELIEEARAEELM